MYFSFTHFAHSASICFGTSLFIYNSEPDRHKDYFYCEAYVQDDMLV